MYPHKQKDLTLNSKQVLLYLLPLIKKETAYFENFSIKRAENLGLLTG